MSERQHQSTSASDADNPYFRELGPDSTAPTPTPLTEQSTALAAEDLDSFALKPRRNPYLRPALWTVAGVFVAALGWQAWQALQALHALHWSLAAAGVATLLATATLAAAATLRFLAGGRDLQQLRSIRSRAEVLLRERGFGHARAWIQDLQAVYEGKPQERLLVTHLRDLPDYENDAEVVRRVSDRFLAPLDQQANQLIWRYSRETGLMVGLSPLALLDMLLALWRSLRMIDALAQIYGVRPSAMGRLRLLRLVVRQLAFVGVSELATDAVSQVTTGALSVGLGLRLGQGLGAGLYTARIGLAAIDICRPVPATEDRGSIMRQLAQSLRQSLQARSPET